MQKGRDDEITRSLPGFRFHPTDEELVGFYLRHKVDKKPMKIDHIIQQIDIYKHDPWDLPKTSEGQDSKELYFFCKRGRKYRNSIRPNRVTGSGFWKATGIDKQVYSSGGGGASIGLKKTLVYYRGSAGKGTKTDWMMHEFRLPTNSAASDKCPTQEAEVWTVCRIMKRNLPHKKCVGDWRKPSLSEQVSYCEYKLPPRTTYILEADDDHHDYIGHHNNRDGGYISFGSGPMTTIQYYDQDKRSSSSSVNNVVNNHHPHDYINNNAAAYDLHGMFNHSPISSIGQAPSASTSSSSYFNTEMDEFAYENWDELRPAVEFALW